MKWKHLSVLFSPLWSLSFTAQLIYLDTTPASKLFFSEEEEQKFILSWNYLSPGTGWCWMPDNQDKHQNCLVNKKRNVLPTAVCSRASKGQWLGSVHSWEGRRKHCQVILQWTASQTPSCLLETCSTEKNNGILFPQALSVRTSTSVFGKETQKLDKNKVSSEICSGAESTPILLSSNRAVSTRSFWGRLWRNYHSQATNTKSK